MASVCFNPILVETILQIACIHHTTFSDSIDPFLSLHILTLHTKHFSKKGNTKLTLAPFWSKASAYALPMNLAPPITTAPTPSNFIINTKCSTSSIKYTFKS